MKNITVTPNPVELPGSCGNATQAFTGNTYTVQTTTAWNFCPHCGRKIEPTHNFCAGCGASVPRQFYSPYVIPSYPTWPYTYPYTTYGGMIGGVAPLTVGGGVAPLTVGGNYC